MPLSSLMIEHGPWLQSRGCRTQRGAQLTAAGRTLIESRAAEPLLPCTAWGRVPRHFPLRPASPPQPRRGHEQTPLTAAARQPSLFLLAHSLSTHRRRDLGGSSPLHAALARRLPVAHRGSPDGTQRPPLTPPSSAREAPRGGPAPPAPRPRCPPPRGHLPAPRTQPHAPPGGRAPPGGGRRVARVRGRVPAGGGPGPARPRRRRRRPPSPGTTGSRAPRSAPRRPARGGGMRRSAVRSGPRRALPPPPARRAAPGPAARGLGAAAARRTWVPGVTWCAPRPPAPPAAPQITLSPWGVGGGLGGRG